MKRTLQIVVLLLTLGHLSSGRAQYGAQKRADHLFSQFAYAKAIPEYQNMLAGDFNTAHAHRQLAECYVLLRDYHKALPHFKAVINDEGTPTDFYLKYGMALISVGEKKAAAAWLKKYKKTNPEDRRAMKLLKDGNLASIVFNSRQRYALQELAFNTSESDFGGYMYQGELYYASGRKDLNTGDTYGWNDEAWLDIYHIDPANPMDTPSPISGDINSKYHESSMIVTTDYKKDTVIYFTRNNFFNNKKAYGLKKEVNLKIYSAIKKDGKWVENRSLPINSDYYSTGHPFVSPDGKRLYYTCNRPGGFGGTDIYYSEIHERGRIGKPINAGPTVNTAGNEMFPFVNAEGQLFFSSDGHPGFGQLDVYSAVTDSLGTITDIINLGSSLNSSADDFGFYADKDGLNGFVSSNRAGGKGSDDIYAFTFTPSLGVEGYIADGVNGQILAGVHVALFDQTNGRLMAETYTDSTGYYTFPINRNAAYLVEASSKTHPKGELYLNTSGTARKTKMLRRDVTLQPVLDLKVLADLNKIYFDFNKSDIRPDAAKELDKVVRLMTITYPEMVIRLEAHTDPVGSHTYNDNLSESRARSTYRYLIEHGIAKERILSVRGYGKRKPINDCLGKTDCSSEKLELNRRTEFPIVSLKGPVSDSELAK
ncbi:OmpA family protein [Sediminicola luteus]|uniref:OmpA-like domain-containing protein n=1 Tax=Sediminicola luteus TaxID=319238 RepID=A0A2A4G7J6_9FLAO|nr:OmpA family protein [Sediminicola luteus]PCE64607.1 hypothetical protein B7P33_10040 [Sediminicola luteus]